MTVRELRTVLAEAIDGEVVKVGYDDVVKCLEPSHKPVLERSGISASVAFKYVKKTPESIKALGMTSKQVLGALKHDVKLPDGRVIQKVDQKTYERILGTLARGITGEMRKKHPDIDVVIHAASSAAMTSEMADIISRTLDVPLVTDAVVKRSRTELEIDEDRFREWAQGKPEAKVTHLRSMLEKHVDEFNRRGQIGDLTSKGTPFEWRQFFNTHSAGPGIATLRGKKVLVVDDNVDKGWTFVGIKKLLMAAGVSSDDIVFAAGFDYAERA